MKWLLRPTTIIVIAILFFASVCLFPSIYYGYSYQDSASWLATIGQHETAYPERYSERQFAKVRIGMTCNEVVVLAGPPLEQSAWSGHTNSAIWWRYSRCASKSGHYNLRGI